MTIIDARVLLADSTFLNFEPAECGALLTKQVAFAVFASPTWFIKQEEGGLLLICEG